MNLYLLFWLLPVALMGLLVIRFLKKFNSLADSLASNVSNHYGAKKRHTLLILTITFIGIIISSSYFIPFKKMIGFSGETSENHTNKCPTIVCPDDFVFMLGKDFEDIVGVFHSKGLEYYRGDTESEGNIDKIILFGKDANSGYNLLPFLIKSNKVTEYGYTYKGSNLISYVINDKILHDNFIEYLKSLGGKILYPENYENFTSIATTNKSDIVYKYKNCVFIDYGYMVVDYGYTFSVFDFGVLKSKNSVESSK